MSVPWVKKPLREVLTLNYGKSLPEKSRTPGNIPVYGSNGVVGNHNMAIVNERGIIVGRKPPAQWRNVYQVTEEYSVHNGYYGNRADVVFLINGIPVLVIECKNTNKDEAIALGIDQLRRYHEETPEMMVPPQLFTVTEAIGFAYGITWNTVRRNIFHWRGDEVGNLEQKIKSFCQIDTLLGFLQDYIVFAEKDEVRIPEQSCHLIQTKAATHSISKLPPIPVKSATPLKFKF